METERILLRPWRESDAGTLYKYASHSGVAAGTVIFISSYHADLHVFLTGLTTTSVDIRADTSDTRR